MATFNVTICFIIVLLTYVYTGHVCGYMSVLCVIVCVYVIQYCNIESKEPGL